MTRAPIKKLRALLQREREALVQGDFSNLDSLLAQKADLLKKLSIAPDIPQDILTRLTKNQELLGAAISGMKSVQDRLKDISASHQNLNAYGQDGRVVGLVFRHDRVLDRRE